MLFYYEALLTKFLLVRFRALTICQSAVILGVSEVNSTKHISMFMTSCTKESPTATDPNSQRYSTDRIAMFISCCVNEALTATNSQFPTLLHWLHCYLPVVRREWIKECRQPTTQSYSTDRIVIYQSIPNTFGFLSASGSWYIRCIFYYCFLVFLFRFRIFLYYYFLSLVTFLLPIRFSAHLIAFRIFCPWHSRPFYWSRNHHAILAQSS